MRGKWILFAVFLIVAAAAGAAFSVLRREAQPKKRAAQTQPVVAKAQFVTLPARLQAKEVVQVSAPISGKVDALHVDVGTEVYEGQLLAEIKSEGLQGERETAEQDSESAKTKISDLESAIATGRLEASRAAADAARTRNDLDRAARTLQRQTILIAEGATPRNVFERAKKDFKQSESESKSLTAVSQKADERVDNMQRELDTARRLLEGKEADLEHAENRIAAGEIHSPVTGVVTSRRGQPGEHVDPSLKQMFQIATDLSSMEAVAQVDPAVTPSVKTGQTAQVFIAEAASELIAGTVTSTDNGKIVVQFANPNPAIKPGLTAQIRLSLNK